MGRPWAAQGPLLLLAAQAVAAQQQECFTGGDIVGAVVGTVVALALLAAAAYFFWKYYWTRRQDGKTLTLVTNDPEAGLTDDHYAFDNPGFLTEDSSPQKKTPLKTSSNDGRSTIERNNINSDNKKGGKVQGKWQAWAPFSAFVGGSSGKGKHNSFKAMDDSFVGEPERDFVPLRGHDFTGLGFNICGNMREGIYVRDVLHRGPASESGRIAAGDRIVSISISLRHMVFEDALTILSYASPYDVQLEIEKRPHGRTIRESGSGKRSPSVGPPDRLCHPFYRSQSIDDLNKMRMSSMGARQAKLKKSENPASTTSVVSTMDRKETAKLEREAAPATKSNVSMPKPERSKKPTTSTTSLASEKKPPTSAEKMAKFGVKVLPFNLTSELGQKLEPKAATEMSQNEQNKKIEEEEEEEVVHEMAVDVPDKMIQVVNEMKHKVEQEKHNIPTEMPEEMRLAAQAAVSHRKSLKEIPAMAAEDAEQQISIEENDRKKRRAPPPPVATAFSNMQLKFEENMSKAEEVLDAEQDKPMTIELGSSQVTIHQAGKEEQQQPEVASPGKGRERKAASLGDLSRFDTDQPMSIPLERAVSLDMVDVNEVERKQQVAPVVSEKAMTDTSIEEEDDDELTPTNTPLQRKEPLTVTDVLAGASDTFNRRLKKSSQWGTLEEALSIEKQHELKTVIAVDEESSGPASITYITPDDAPAAPPSPPTSPPPTVTFVSTASPTVQHVTEIQVLSMGDNPIDFPSSTTIRHGTSGGSLLVVQSRDPPDEAPFTNNHHDGEADDNNEKFESDTDVQVMATNVTVTPVNLEKEVMQISAAELDDIMMSHSSYLKTADNQFNTFEQWVFLEPPTADENSKNEIIPPVVNHETNHKEFQSK
ncbi:Hypothetical predicted protein [Cloeon dipterum]|uniref:PDZ domain-containing protein n=3 Tax=Cloeon dipterum TaxID=197152 RepID=A0A8S1C1A5_9INSE|nr:Hypothetical predicted protein [Cloeon dipterum]